MTNLQPYLIWPIYKAPLAASALHNLPKPLQSADWMRKLPLLLQIRTSTVVAWSDQDNQLDNYCDNDICDNCCIYCVINIQLYLLL